MKTTAVVTLACLASASAFTPSSNVARASTSLAAEKKAAPAKKSLFRTIAEMDLFAPKADQNDYGARNKKNVRKLTASTL